MRKQFAAKRGLKRRKFPEKLGASTLTKKSRRQIEDSPSPSSSGDLSDEHFDGVPQEMAHSDSSMYDALLKALKSSNKSLSDGYKERQRKEEGEGYLEEDEGKDKNEDEEEDEDEDEGEDPGSLNASTEEDSSEEETDNESSRTHVVEDMLPEPITAGITDDDGDTESEDDREASDIDLEHAFSKNGNSVVEASAATSSFHVHLSYNLSESEVENFSKKKWKYQWDAPAFEMSNCKWVGTGECFLKDANIDSDYGLKHKLYGHWLDVFQKSGSIDFHSSKQRHFFSLCNSYRDILHCNKKPFYLKGIEEDSSIMDAYIMHSLNHIFRTRDLVTKNDAKAAKLRESSKDELLIGDGFLDQGFTRPKVLILLPFRSFALRLVKRLIQLTPQADKVNVEHKDRFYDEFGTQEDDDNVDNDNLIQNGGNPKSAKSSKPSDHQKLFGGNNDDLFMIGIKFTRKSIKLYSDFYSSDMIVASSLGVVNKINETKRDKEKDVDYFSSIEVLIVDHADVIAMQNWACLNSVLEQLNCIPSKQHGTDIMRIRKWYLDGLARFYRQTIILGCHVNPDINASFNHQCVNYQGKVKMVCEYKGVMPKVIVQVRQIYERFDADSIADADDARLEYFMKKVFPKIKDSTQGGTMIFISSYLEYVRLRNFLKSQNASFCLLGDYAKPKDISRARVWFFEGKRKIMLYTERAHFYKRYKIRGIRNLIIYSLPERKEFYPEVVNMFEGAHTMTCTTLFCRFDLLRLERIVGTAPARRMVTSEKGVFVFC